MRLLSQGRSLQSAGALRMFGGGHKPEGRTWIAMAWPAPISRQRDGDKGALVHRSASSNNLWRFGTRQLPRVILA